MNSPEQDNHREFSMADISGKAVTNRRALAVGRISVGAAAFELLKEGRLPKGNALAMGEVAGIQGAKLTPQLLPLCHPIALSRVSIHSLLRPAEQAVDVYALAEISERTGVEMEALTGVTVALLTIWDLTKPIEAALDISGVKLLYKEGGKSGEWTHPDGLDDDARAILSSD